MLGPSSRPSLPTSSSDFALPPSTSSPSTTSPTYAADDLSPFMLRFRRPSLLVPRPTAPGDRPLRSPLATTSTTRSSSTTVSPDESESERENVKMWTDDTPPSGNSGSGTPLLPGPTIVEPQRNRDGVRKRSRSRPRSPSTPPPRNRGSSALNDFPPEAPNSVPRAHGRRLSHNVRVPRILSLISQSRPEESEVQSEAQFQRLVASCCELPSHQRIPRAASDRGRYPEEADVEEPHREDTPSDDGELDDAVPFAYVQPISIMKPVTPAHSVNGDDMGMLDSPGGMAMDVDMPSSSMGSPIVSSWRYTPPPTSSAVRNNKRKVDDRYDPYPTANKRRAVSPSLSYLRESQPSLFNSRIAMGTPRLTMPTPVPISTACSSAASSPIVGSSSSYFARGSTSVMSSPTLRAQIGLSSPVLRPILPRPKRHGEDEREVEGAGEAVGGLTLS
ncbi:uncharacterized protein FIBRA_00073 [Fibroporia radiculosa]|uniref:Uncharacterized protein n=1 Tax=Fibroporia radiculosa TaxID=599839 RepID=J7S5K9_9APHY|nr:uncharacterized protein FIBRA_00073 [Fibroporia radiculosa]CCL98079.1 predicted protein [Fibroporia radiculosa]